MSDDDRDERAVDSARLTWDGFDRPWGQGSRPAVQSVGSRKVFNKSSGQFINLKLESPSPKQLRLSYDGEEWAKGLVWLVRATILTNVDGATIRQVVQVPWQGIALSVPAGASQVIVDASDGYSSDPIATPTGNILQVEMSAGLPGFNERRGFEACPLTGLDDGWGFVAGNPFNLYPPLFAVSAVIQNVDSVNQMIVTAPLAGISITLLPLQVIDTPIPDPGWYRLSTTWFIPVAYTVRWRVSA